VVRFTVAILTHTSRDRSPLVSEGFHVVDSQVGL